MKIIHQYNTFLGATFVLSFITSGSLCFSAEQETIATLEKQVTQLEEIWKAGKTNEYFFKAKEIAKKITPSMNITYTEEQYQEANKLLKAGKTNAYYAKIEEFNKEFLSHSITGNPNKIAAKLFDNIISKNANVIDVGNNDLYALEDLMRYLLPNEKVFIKERRMNALLLSRYLGKIRKELIPDFKPKPVDLKPRPPPGVGPSTSGMPPSAITNPVLRAQYEAVIQENRENNLINSRQQKLRSMGDKLTSTRVIDYIIDTFNADDVSTPLFIECVNSACLTDQEKEQILKKVGSKKPKQGETTAVGHGQIKK